MKASNLTATAALGIIGLRWLSFTQANPGGSYVALGASITPTHVAVISLNGSPAYPSFAYRFTAASLPSWIKPGSPVKIAASVTLSSNSIDISGYYIVSAISGSTFTVVVPREGSRITMAVASTALDSGSGKVATPLVSLVMQCQKAMLKASSGSVTIAPAVGSTGAADYEVSLDTNSGEYEVTSQPGSKFDLADWSVKGTGTLAVRFK